MKGITFLKQLRCKHNWQFKHVAYNGFKLYHFHQCNRCKKERIVNLGD